VLLDISLPDKSGLECLKDIKKLSPNMPVLMLSMHAEHQFATRALKSGASGYLPKQNATAEIVKAVKKVLSGGRYLSPACAEQLALTAVFGGDTPTHEQLTQREHQIMRLIASGKTVGEIATMLSRSAKTISSHRVRILEKLKLKTNAELIVYCVRLGLVD
jgi:DNA-binding NarL/FixJ family response regulator